MKRICTIALALTLGCKRQPAPSPPAPPKPAADIVELSENGLKTADIKTQKVGIGTFKPRAVLAGSITGDPTHLAQIGSSVAGRVTAIRVTLGERVKKGQVLLDVDTAELHETTLKYLTAVARARAAKDVLARQRQLVDERVGAVQELRRAETEDAAAVAALNEASEHLQFLGLSTDQVARIDRGGTEGSTKSQVRSPIDGQVSTLDVSLGRMLANNESIITVADVKDVWAALRVYERDLAGIQTGAAVEIHVPTYEGRAFEGKVSFVSDVLDPRSRSADVRVAVTNTDGALRPGMSATGFAEKAGSTKQLWLPVESVQAHDGHPVVFFRRDARKFEAKAVNAGPEEGGFVPIVSGVTAEDEIVVHGAFALRAELERAALEE